MKKRVKRSIKIIFVILATLIVCLFFVRLINPTEIDDVSPGINCTEIGIYNPDTLYVIPDYSNNPISENKKWCDYILSLNKTLELHGITHTYKEFLYENITKEELNFGISEFEKCFNKTPEMFKPPQLEISKENKQLIKDNNLKLRTRFNQITHKVYHCSDSAKPRNKIIYIF
jgi:predicted deacetylase